MLPIVIAIGRLGRDPELKATSKGTDMARFSIACDNPGRSAQWVNITCFGRSAQAAKEFAKGDLVLIRGQLETGVYEKEGKKQYFTSVVADSLERFDAPGRPGQDRDVDDRNVPC